MQRRGLIALHVLLVALAGCRNGEGGSSSLPDASPAMKDGQVDRVQGDTSAPPDVLTPDGPSVEAVGTISPDAAADGEPNAAGQDATIDVGPLPCGSSTCAPGQYCVSKSGGPAPRCFPHPDGGGCPAHTTEECSFPPGPGCQEVPEPSLSCESIPPSCAAQEPCRCLCFLAPGPVGGCFITDRQLSCNYP
jgi:hypothetical protein